jgi:hypothetical protein
MNRAQLKELVKNIMSEESEYQAFFQKALEKAGKSIPSMSDDEKKAFFNKIDSAWDGKGEKNEGNAFGAAVTAAKKAGEDEFEVGGETYKVEEKLVGGQKKLDVDGDGEIESSDLADLRAGKKADEGMELPKATIPSAVKSKLDMAIDKIKDSDLTYNQKVQVVGQVMDSLGIDKAEFNKMTSKLKGTMESVNESRESDILAQIEKLRVAANSGKITGAQFQDKFYPLWKELKTMNKNNESINEENIGLSKGNDNLVMKTLENLIGQDIEYKRKDEKLGKNYYSSTVEFFTKRGFAALSISGTNLNDDFTVKIKDKGFNSLKNYEVEFVEGEKNAIKMAIGLVKKYGKKYFGLAESVNESLIANDGKILLNGKLVGYYDYDRDSAAFWTTDLSDKQFRGSQAFDTKEEMLAFFKKYLSKAAKALEYQRKALSKFGIKYPADESVNSETKKVNEEKIDWADFYKMAKDTSGYNPNFEKKYGKVLDRPHVADAVKTAKDFKSFMKFIQKFENINEGKYDADLDKIEAAVKNATSFMNVGTELKKAGIKYDFTTSMIPMYMIKVSGNTIAVVNKKYAAGAEREVKDIAIGLLN